jgi:hypothetical protein
VDAGALREDKWKVGHLSVTAWSSLRTPVPSQTTSRSVPPVSGPPLALRVTRPQAPRRTTRRPSARQQRRAPSGHRGHRRLVTGVEGAAADVLKHLLAQSSAASGAKAMTATAGLPIQGTTPVELPSTRP